MSENYFQDQSNATSHTGDIVLDPAIISALPINATVITAQGHGVSNWNVTGYVEFSQSNQTPTRWFLKIATRDRGRAMVYGEYESMIEICKVTPSFAPRPLCWGSCLDSDSYFFLCEFHDLDSKLPHIPDFVREVAKLHKESYSPNGMFGFHVTTCNGTLEQGNTWTDSWEKFYSLGTVRMLTLNEAARGPNVELKQLSKELLDKVIPRLLRPLETQGRKVKPSLLHGDLWIGNVATNKATGQPMIFDSSAYYGHHEYELSTLGPLNNDWSRECIEMYHTHIPKDEPVEDWDSRNALYALLIKEMRHLVNQFPDGYVEDSCLHECLT